MPGKFRKKPVTIEAMRLVDSPAHDYGVFKWVEENTAGVFDYLEVCDAKGNLPQSGISIDPYDGHFVIATLEGLMKSRPGDWIIRGVAGEFYPCKAEIFLATYEAVDE